MDDITIHLYWHDGYPLIDLTTYMLSRYNHPLLNNSGSVFSSSHQLLLQTLIASHPWIGVSLQKTMGLVGGKLFGKNP